MISSRDVDIRPATADDIEAIIALDRRIENLPHWPAGEYHAILAEGESHPARCLFIAETAGQLHGLASATVHTIAEDRIAELETVGVTSAMQRQGLGRRLCQAVVAWCREHDVMHIDLEVRSRSAGARALYRSLGFATIGHRSGYYRSPSDDAVLMRLSLKPDETEAVPADQTPSQVDL